MIFKVKDRKKTSQKKELKQETSAKRLEHAEVKDKLKEELKEKEIINKDFGDKLIEENKDSIPKYFEEYSSNGTNDWIEVRLPLNDEEYEPPQWFRQQAKKKMKYKTDEESENRNTDINISKEFSKETQIDESSFEDFYALINDLKFLNKENLFELYQKDINFTARIVEGSKGKHRRQTIK